MELVDGKNLIEYIQAFGPLGEERAKPLARKLIQAFNYMHSQASIAHRDIKCLNIMVDSNLNPKVIDFGLCDHTQFTKLKKGTDGYLPASLISGGRNFVCDGAKHDVFAFGVTLLEIVLGGCAFKEASARDPVYKHLIAANKAFKGNNIEKSVKEGRRFYVKMGLLGLSKQFRDFILRQICEEDKSRWNFQMLLGHEWLKESDDV